MINFFKRGITAMELLVVIAVLAIIFAVALPQFSKIRENAVLKDAVNTVLSSIDKAKNQTIASLNSSEYGVRFESDKVIIFKGTAYSAGTSTNEVINITSPASISNVTLAGASSTFGEMYFNRIFNMPSATGTITVLTSSLSKTITIYATGLTSSD